MRSIHKEWKTPKSGFTHRIRWYQASDGSNIRLHLEDTEGEANLFPSSREEANRLWELFRDLKSIKAVRGASS